MAQSKGPPEGKRSIEVQITNNLLESIQILDSSTIGQDGRWKTNQRPTQEPIRPRGGSVEPGACSDNRDLSFGFKLTVLIKGKTFVFLATKPSNGIGTVTVTPTPTSTEPAITVQVPENPNADHLNFVILIAPGTGP